jgi:hypothetical protein
MKLVYAVRYTVNDSRTDGSMNGTYENDKISQEGQQSKG